MWLVKQAWSYVTKETIVNYWKHAGILQKIDNKVILADTQDVVTGLQSAFSSLLLTKTIAKINVPTIEDLVKVQQECITEDILIDEEIVEASTQVTIADAISNKDDNNDNDDNITAMDTPIMLISSACVIINELEQFCLQHPEVDFQNAFDMFYKLWMSLHHEWQSSLQQTRLTQFFHTV